MKKKAFRMRQEPKRPDRYTVRKTKGVGYATLSSIINLAEKLKAEKGVPLSKIKLEYGTMVWHEPESDAAFEKRLADWQVKKNEYDAWAKEYADEILAYNKAKALEKAKKLKDKMDKVRERQAKLDDELNKLKKQAIKEEELISELLR